MPCCDGCVDADNTSEVGLIKILKTARISDGIVRLYYVAGGRALALLNDESSVINHLISEWGISQDDLLPTASRFFEGYKRLGSQVSKQASTILDLTLKVHLLDPAARLLLVRSSQPTPTLYIANMPQYADKLKETGKGVVFVGEGFAYGLLGAPVPGLEQKTLETDLKRLAEAESRAKAEKVEEKSKHDAETGRGAGQMEEKKEETAGSVGAKKEDKALLVKLVDSLTVSKGKDKKTGKKLSEKLTGVVEFTVFRLNVRADSVLDYFAGKGFTRGEDQ